MASFARVRGLGAYACGQKILGVKEIHCDPLTFEVTGSAICARGTLIVCYGPRTCGDTGLVVKFECQAELAPGDVTVLVAREDLHLAGGAAASREPATGTVQLATFSASQATNGLSCRTALASVGRACLGQSRPHRGACPKTQGR